MKKLKVLLILGLVLALFTGCSSSSGGTSDGDGASTKKILTVATDTDLSTMDQNIATDGTSFIAINACISGLTQLDADGNVLPELAETWDVVYNDDGSTVYTFHLADANWSNGTPVTAADFVFGWQRLADPATASEYNFIVSTIKLHNADAVIAGELPVDQLGVKALDDKTLEVTLDLPVDFFLSLMAFPTFFPLNEEFYLAQGDQYAVTPANLLYCGPFVMTEWVSGNSFTFEKNETYFKADEVKIDGITFKYIQDTQSAMLEFESGNLDYVKLTGELVESYSDDAEFVQRLQGYLWYLSVNFNDESIDSVNLRKAISTVINRDSIAENILKDGSIAAEGIIPKALATGPDGKDYRATASELVTTDVEQAKAYWEAAKVDLGVDTLNIELLFEDTEASKAVAEFIQSEIETNLEGLTVTLKSQPKKSRLELMRTGDYQLGLTRWGPDYADPQTYLDLFLTENTNSGYSSAAYDATVLEATTGETAKDSSARWAMLQEAERILLEDDCAVIPIYQNGGALMISSKVHGIELHAVGIDNFSRVTIDD